MDRMLYVSMSGAKQLMNAQRINSNNLANVSTQGFRADYFQQRSMQVFGEGMPTRFYAMTERPGFNQAPGNLETTGRELDVAIKGDGWFVVDAGNGEEAMTRAGSLRLSSDGGLYTSDGRRVMGSAGPISLPPLDKIEIARDGTISILPQGQDPSALAVVDRLKLVNPPPETLMKGADGLVRIGEPGVALVNDPKVEVVAGAVESSNVNAIDALVEMIELSRQYEMQVKMMALANETDQAATRMMRL